MSCTILRDDRPTARKQHRCSDCQRLIERGETYRSQSNVGDDGLYVWKMCVQCDAVFDWIFRTDPDVRYYADDGLDLAEYVREYDLGVRSLFAARWLRDGAVVPVDDVLVILAASEQPKEQPETRA